MVTLVLVPKSLISAETGILFWGCHSGSGSRSQSLSG